MGRIQGEYGGYPECRSALRRLHPALLGEGHYDYSSPLRAPSSRLGSGPPARVAAKGDGSRMTHWSE